MTMDQQAPVLESAPKPSADSQRGALGYSLYFVRTFGSVGLLVILGIVFTFTTSTFLTGANIKSVLIVQTIVAAMTLGLLFPLIVGEFDLSIGFSVGFLSMFIAWLAENGLGLFPLIVTVAVVALFIGLVNGVLVEYFHISSFIATLAIGTVLQGITEGLSGGQVLSQHIPSFVTTLGTSYWGPLGISVWVILALAVIVFYVLEHTPFGRSLYAIGGNERVAFLAGIRTRRSKIICFMVGSLFVAVAAAFSVGQNGSASPTYGPDLLLPTFAAAFLAVTAFRPGYYNVVGAMVGILLLAFGFNGLTLWNTPSWVQPIFNGGVLVVAVLTARSEARRLKVAS
jgi:ribose transport system permease protein